MQVTFDDIIKLAIILMGIWGFVKVIMEIVKAITARHDREQKWDDMAESINSSRENIIQKYDFKLADMEKKIDENHSDTESKLQQIRAEQEQIREEQFIITSSMFAVLDGLEQLGANHNVSKAKLELQDYLNKASHR